MQKLLSLFILLSCACPVWAHVFWLKPEVGGAVLIYGHGEQSEVYKPEVVKSILAVGVDGRKRDVSKTVENGKLKMQAANASCWAVEIDNGFWTKTLQGWKNKSKRAQPKYLQSTWERAFAKAVGPDSLGLVTGHTLEITLTSATPNLIEGKVLLRGKPAPGIALEQDHRKLGSTNANGKFSFKPKGQGLVVIKAHHQEALQGNPDADSLNLDATLTVKV